MKWALWIALPLAGQSLQVFSEYARFNAAGEVTAPPAPREILSPALVRNGFTSFQIVVRVEPGTPYSLVAGENPADAVKLTVYREAGDKLEPIELPYQTDRTQVFWLDVWTDREAPVRRIKVEPQIQVKDDWVVYPMETRVMDATVPEDVSVESVCGVRWREETDVARMHVRNERQDAALASRVPTDELTKVVAGCDTNPPEEPEFYLRIRDYLFRMR